VPAEPKPEQEVSLGDATGHRVRLCDARRGYQPHARR
jgi:hypothetical protein